MFFDLYLKKISDHFLNKIMYGNIKVGISWRGGRSYAQKRGRSINLSELMQHLPKNFSYVSLQYDASESDIKEAEDSSQRKIYF